MLRIEEYKQLDDLVTDETNVKNIVRKIGMTEEGELSLNYNRKTRAYTFVLPNRVQPAKDATVVAILAKNGQISDHQQ